MKSNWLAMATANKPMTTFTAQNVFPIPQLATEEKIDAVGGERYTRVKKNRSRSTKQTRERDSH